jgi:uncharacterized membrane protein
MAKKEKKKKKQSLFIVAFKGRDTANEVYDTLNELKKEKKVKIKTAAVVYRKDNGKLKLVHKHRVTTWGGAAIGTGLAVLLAGIGGGAVLVGAVVGGALGGIGHTDRKRVKEFLDDKLGTDDSAVAILIRDANWQAVKDAIDQYGGEELAVELTPEAEAQIGALAEHAEVAEAVAEEVEVEDEVED